MALDAINKIQEAEAIALKTIEGAMDDSKKIISKAQQEAEKEYKSLIDLAMAKAKQMKEDAFNQGKKDSEPTLAKGEEDVKVILNTSKGKFDSAVSLVIERIVKFNGNS